MSQALAEKKFWN